jgi:hypothetical protein
MAGENGNDDQGQQDQNDDGQDQDQQDQNDDGQDDEGSGEYKAPDEAEWKKVTGTIAKQKETAKSLRRQLAELKEQIAKDKDGKDDEGEKDRPKADPDARVKRLAVTAALAGEGLTKAQAKRAAGMVDLSEIEVDEDGDADLEDVIDELKETFPALFGAKETTGTTRRPRTSGGRSNDGGGRTPDQKNSDALLRAAGYR